MKTILEKLNNMIKKGKQFGKINKNEKNLEKLIKIKKFLFKKLIYIEIFDKNFFLKKSELN